MLCIYSGAFCQFKAVYFSLHLWGDSRGYYEVLRYDTSECFFNLLISCARYCSKWNNELQFKLGTGFWSKPCAVRCYSSNQIQKLSPVVVLISASRGWTMFTLRLSHKPSSAIYCRPFWRNAARIWTRLPPPSSGIANFPLCTLRHISISRRFVNLCSEYTSDLIHLGSSSVKGLELRRLGHSSNRKSECGMRTWWPTRLRCSLSAPVSVSELNLVCSKCQRYRIAGGARSLKSSFTLVAPMSEATTVTLFFAEQRADPATAVQTIEWSSVLLAPHTVQIENHSSNKGKSKLVFKVSYSDSWDAGVTSHF